MIIPNLNSYRLKWLDLTAKNKDLLKVDLKNTSKFNHWLFDQLKPGELGIGGWLENRNVYHRSSHFEQTEYPRTIHLGLDIWTSAGTPVLSANDGLVVGLQDNKGFGDYGPTVIIKHNDHFTLYGHLTRNDLNHLAIGQRVIQGQVVGHIGPFPENGDWPPHVHFQVMKHLDGNSGDFPGVCAEEDLNHFKNICMNPLEYLGIKKPHEEA